MDKVQFGVFIAKTRRKVGLTQRSLAEQLHVTDKAVSKWERGLCYPDLTLMENLASVLGLTMTELMTCQKGSPEVNRGEDQTQAVKSLLDISSEAMHTQRRNIWKWLTAITALIVLAITVTYFSTTVAETFHSGITFMQMDGENGYFYIERDGHLLRFRCADQQMYDSIVLDDTICYEIDCRWNKLTYSGIAKAVQPVENEEVIGTMMDMTGSIIGVDSLFDRACVWQEYMDIYPDPKHENGFLYTYRYFYCGDGSTYDDGEETELLTVENCRKTYQADHDNDGIVELFVLTKFDEEPYQLFDMENGKITSRFVDEVPQEALEWFKMPQ